MIWNFENFQARRWGYVFFEGGVGRKGGGRSTIYLIYRIKAYSIEKKKRKNGGNIGFEVDKVTLKLPSNHLLHYVLTIVLVTLWRNEFNAVW